MPKKTTGFICKCGSKMGVYYTIPQKGKIKRGRQCDECGYIRQTIEIPFRLRKQYK